ncbi:MAG: methyl-accepting chemotaxis protein [Pirellulaceae bacterium]
MGRLFGRCRADGRDVSTEVVAVERVLPTLSRQLRGAVDDVEASVVGVCTGFQGMAQRARSAVGAAQETVGAAGDDPSGTLQFEEMQAVLGLLLDNVRATCEFSQTASARLARLEQQLDRMQNTLNEVEDISNKARLVALNGQVEAARLGDAGRAFGIVARETKTLSMQAAATSESIRNGMNELTVELRSTSAEIRDRADDNTKRFAESESTVRQLLSDLESSHRNMVHSLQTTAEISRELGQDIARAVMSMQFQDRVSQRVGHVVDTLETILQRLAALPPVRIDAVAERRISEWLREIEAQYTMDSERLAHVDVDGVMFDGPNGQQSASDDEGCLVELF